MFQTEQKSKYNEVNENGKFMRAPSFLWCSNVFRVNLFFSVNGQCYKRKSLHDSSAENMPSWVITMFLLSLRSLISVPSSTVQHRIILYNTDNYCIIRQSYTVARGMGIGSLG